MKTNEKKVVEKKKSDKVKRGVSAGFVILCCFIIAQLFFNFVCGDPANFIDGNPKGHPIQGNIFGTLYKGGVIIPFVMTLLLTVITLSVERFFAMNRANGKGNLVQFVHDVKRKLDANDIKGAHELCNAQKGATANILNAALIRYEDVEKIDNLNNDEKAA
ncbi:MAG: MotA/TolQ/ExbB proton channel family protein, partial [Bacteroidales bacterium]|nr:MotA/TolQ/ExbB proton channel family protein [Bacteroidales bacterium]